MSFLFFVANFKQLLSQHLSQLFPNLRLPSYADLVVGSPWYTSYADGDYPADTGRVYIYPGSWNYLPDPFEPIVIDGKNMACHRAPLLKTIQTRSNASRTHLDSSYKINKMARLYFMISVSKCRLRSPG